MLTKVFKKSLDVALTGAAVGLAATSLLLHLGLIEVQARTERLKSKSRREEEYLRHHGLSLEEIRSWPTRPSGSGHYWFRGTCPLGEPWSGHLHVEADLSSVSIPGYSLFPLGSFQGNWKRTR